MIEKAVVEFYVVHDWLSLCHLSHFLASSSVNSLVKSLSSLEVLKVCHAAPMRSHWPSKSSGEIELLSCNDT